MTRLEELIKELPPEYHKEAQDFLEFLIAKKKAKPRGPLKLNWRGALRDLRDKYTSVELQHKAQE
ncbi:MAG: DUF2281 domain-containing protein [Euryarchaeota archaeon]|nr:DUF2281 domain-containing protein [Euryarchaeota archaeon]